MNLTVTAVAQPTNTPPRVQLTVTDSDHTAPADAVTLLRVAADGSTTPVRVQGGGKFPLGADGSGGRIGTTWDYQAPFGLPVTYKTTETPVAPSGAVTLTSSRVWLQHPGQPALSLPVTVTGIPARTHAVNQVLLTPAGRATAVPVGDGQRKAPTGQINLRTRTLADLQALLALLADGSPLLLNVPATKGWGVDTTFIAPGELTETRTTTYGPDPYREWTLPYATVALPVGGVLSQRSFTDLATEAPDFASLRNKYTSFLQMTTG